MYCANVVCRIFCNSCNFWKYYENLFRLQGWMSHSVFFQKLYEKFKHLNSFGIDCVKLNRTFVQIPQRPLIRAQYCSCSDKTSYVFGPSTCTNLHFSKVSSMVFQNTCSGSEKYRRFWRNSDDLLVLRAYEHTKKLKHFLAKLKRSKCMNKV